jgi:aspartate carbamoyltransferase catalytic subunit
MSWTERVFFMKNLFHLGNLSVQEIMCILDQAKEFKQGMVYEELKGKKIANLFFEPSTRTQYSFIVAEENLGILPTNFNVESSSVKKGESLYDTVKTFEMIGYDGIVIRHPATNYYKELENINIPIISGGDGIGNHPTQSLLDLMTILEEFKKFEGLKIAFIGDIMHSRVAHTNIHIMRRLGMEVFTSGPFELDDFSSDYIDYETAIKTMDILMFLRVQYERHGVDVTFSKEKYHESYGLTEERVKKMKPNAIIMHPAPYNRGVELSDYSVECEKSRIMKQMQNGVYIRMAVLKRAFEKE